MSEVESKREPGHTVCIGWPTIRRVASEGAVYFAEQDVALVAADDLFHADVDIAAAEERGRRRAEMERDELRACLDLARSFVSLQADRRPSEYNQELLTRIDKALAPRDSGKVPGSINVAELFDPAGDEE